MKMLMDFRQFSAACLIALTLLFTYETAYANAATLDYSRFIVAVPAVAEGISASGILTAAAAVVSTATAAVTGVLASNPVGWAAIGVGVVVAGIYVYAMQNGQPTAVIVSSQPLSVQPNADIAAGVSSTPVVPVPALFAFKSTAAIPYLYYDKSECVANPLKCHTGSPANVSAVFLAFAANLREYYKNAQNLIVSDVYAVPASTSSAECPSASSPAGFCIRTAFTSTTALTAAQLALFNWNNGSAANTVINATASSTLGTPLSCDGNTSYYDYDIGTCMLKTPPANSNISNDGICNVSFSNAGNPVYNPFDLDCMRAKDKFLMSITKGTATVPPSVAVTDATGKTTSITRPATAGQGTPGSIAIKEVIPNIGSNTTTTGVTNAVPAIPTASNPAGAPVASGVGSTVVQGVGVNAGTTPVAGVIVDNWPATQSVTCTNCTAAIPAELIAGITAISAVPEGAPVDLPASPPADGADAVPATNDQFLDPIKSKLEGFAGFHFPAHSSVCAPISISFHAWRINIDASSNFMCDFLENNRTLFQSLATFTALITAVVIVLGA